MPKCAKCGYSFHPSFLTDFEIKAADPEIKQCYFCATEKDVFTIGPDENGEMRTYTKEEAVRDYQTYLNKLNDKFSRGDQKKLLRKMLRGEEI